MGHKGHYGEYSGNARHSKHHMVNSWEEEDVKRGRKEMEEGHKGHAEALFDDAHGSYNWDGHNSTGAEHGLSRKSRSERLRKRAMNRSERTGAEWGDYDYEDPRVQKMLEKANELEARTGEGRKAMNKLTKKIEKMPDGPVWGTSQHEGFHGEISQYSGNSPFNQLAEEYANSFNERIGVHPGATAAFEKGKEIEMKFEDKIEKAGGYGEWDEETGKYKNPKINRLNKRANNKMARKVPRAYKKANKKGYVDGSGKSYSPLSNSCDCE